MTLLSVVCLFSCSTVDLTENAQDNDNIYSILLTSYMVTTELKNSTDSMVKFGVWFKSCFPVFLFNCISVLQFPNMSVIPSLIF